MRASITWLLLAAMQCLHLKEAVCADAVQKASAPAFNARQLVSLPTDGWLTNGGNLYNQRYSPLHQVDRDNVAKLKAEWRASLRGSGMGARSGNQAQRSGRRQPSIRRHRGGYRQVPLALPAGSS